MPPAFPGRLPAQWRHRGLSCGAARHTACSSNSSFSFSLMSESQTKSAKDVPLLTSTRHGNEGDDNIIVIIAHAAGPCHQLSPLILATAGGDTQHPVAMPATWRTSLSQLVLAWDLNLSGWGSYKTATQLRSRQPDSPQAQAMLVPGALWEPAWVARICDYITHCAHE